MDVLSRIVWGVELDDPVYSRDVKSASSNICGEQYARFSVDEFEKCVGSLLLFLFALRRWTLEKRIHTVTAYAREGRAPERRCNSAARHDI